MTIVFLSIMAAMSALALGISVVSLLVQWKRPEQSDESARLEAEIIATRASIADLWDKVEHWMKRDRVRNLRAAKEKPGDEPEPETHAQTPVDKKSALRSKVRAIAGGNNS